MCSMSTKLTIPQTNGVCVCLCVCQGPPELQGFLQSHRSEEWRENTKDTLSYKSTSPPSLSVPLGKVILSSKTFSSLLHLSLPLFFFSFFFLSVWSFTLQFPLFHSVSVCLAALCHYYGPICVNANIPFIMGEWFPPGLGGLTYLTSHIFTMVASAPLQGQRSEFQTS